MRVIIFNDRHRNCDPALLSGVFTNGKEPQKTDTLTVQNRIKALEAEKERLIKTEKEDLKTKVVAVESQFAANEITKTKQKNKKWNSL